MFESLLPVRCRQPFRNSPHVRRMKDLAAGLTARGRRPVTVRMYLTEWMQFLCYYGADRRVLPSGISDQTVVAYLELRDKGRKERDHHARAALRALFAGAVSRRRIPSEAAPTTPLFDSYVPAYLEFARLHRGRRNVRGVTEILRQFFAWLARSEIGDVGRISPVQVRDYLGSLGHLQRSTIAGHASGLRCFLRYLAMRGHVPVELPLSVDAPRLYRMSDPPPVLDGDAVRRLIKAVDRSSAIGKRDYAILLLAARYGMRPCDIRSLRLEDVHWRQRRIALIQAKTQRQVELPLLDDVEDALVDYLRNARPACEARAIFVGHRPPFQPLSRFNCLWDVMGRAFHAAQIERPSGRRGLYLLRHSAATNMLAHGASFDAISGVLGHASAETTRIYALVDLPALRSVALSEGEVRS